MRDLQRPRPGRRRLQDARLEAHRWPPLRQVLDLQLPDGSFPYRQRTPTAQPTFIALCLMQRCGMDRTDPPVEKTIHYLSFHHLSKGALSYTGGGSGILPCYLGVVTTALIGMGALDTELVQSSLHWLIAHQRFDHKEGRAGGSEQWPYKAPVNYRCWESVSCYHGVAGAFRALAAVPKEQRWPELDQRLTEAVSYLRARRLYKRTGGDTPVVRHLVRPFLVGDYRSSLLDMLHGIADTDDSGLHTEPWVRSAVEDMEGLTEDGKVPLATNYARRLVDDGALETLGEPSRFLTHEWEVVRARLLPEGTG